MEAPNIVFRVHVLQRMFQRSITEEDVQHVLENGEVIKEYLDDTPFPSRLLLGWRDKRPLHVVATDNKAENKTYVIRVYEPDPQIWAPDFRRKKS
ncbi:MAG: DUF4258 domain-containing protein [Ktedonobacterales bacterium]|nr:DUF4258 domain-containing protein [Ktedonobacterales bacterium]